MGDLLKKIQSKESKEDDQVRKHSVSTNSIKKKSSGKNKMISAKVNDAMYNQFSAINHARGASNNSILNMLISDYVAKHKSILEDIQ